MRRNFFEKFVRIVEIGKELFTDEQRTKRPKYWH